MTRTDRALEWAIEQHGEQRYGDEPYAVHLRAVVEIVRGAGGSEVAQTAAALHDVVEDVATTTRAEIEAEFGAEVADVVAALSKPPRDTPRRLEVYFESIARTGSDAVLVKLADRIANVEASTRGPSVSPRLMEKYRREADRFRAHLHRPGQHDDLWARLEELLQASQ